MKGQKGNFTIILLLSCVVFLTLAGVIFFLSTNKNENTQQSAVDPKTFFEEYKARVEAALNDSHAFQVSIERNANQFGCLYTVSGACKGQGGNFLLFEKKDNKETPLSQIVRATGLNAEGALCNGFPSHDCPIRAEAEWQPVCGGAVCEATKSMNVKVSLRFDTGETTQTPLTWNKTAFLTPDIALTASVQCAREGGVFDGGRCLTGAEAQRLPASNPTSSRVQQTTNPASNQVQGQEQNVYQCPDRIVVQGIEQVPYIDASGKARIESPASNGCPNAYDVFTFQCSPTNSQEYPNEGQWVQTEAVLAPACDERGIPYDTSQAPIEVRN